jgi:hypothetical protein
MCRDAEFVDSEYFKSMKWLKDDREDIFDASYSDILRISFMYKFGRGKLKDLVSLLGGRDFETREYKEAIAEESFRLLKDGVVDFMNQYSHQNFILAIKSAGVIAKRLINSDITLDFAYTLYLLLKADPTLDNKKVDQYVQKWYVLSTLTSRYITSPESVMDADLRAIKAKDSNSSSRRSKRLNFQKHSGPSDWFRSLRHLQSTVHISIYSLQHRFTTVKMRCSAKARKSATS